jgi:hypothetical protein
MPESSDAFIPRVIFRFRRVLVFATRSGEGPFTHPLPTSIIVQRKPVAC